MKIILILMRLYLQDLDHAPLSHNILKNHTSIFKGNKILNAITHCNAKPNYNVHM